jgi:hypothetical protein
MVAAVSDRRSQAAIALIVGTMALYLGRSDAALAYVKAGLQPPLVASGVILIGLGLVAVAGHGDDQQGDQPHGPRVAWLLALPPLALVLIPRRPWARLRQPATDPAATCPPTPPDRAERRGGSQQRRRLSPAFSAWRRHGRAHGPRRVPGP